MSLHIGKVSKLFGITPETLRYYESEGFLLPKKNPSNGYREYTFKDILLLTDLLFYRDIGIPIKDIREIFNGMRADEVPALIGTKKVQIQEKIQYYKDFLVKLENWESLHTESLQFYEKYDIRPMPAALYKKNTYGNYSDSLFAFQKDLRSDQSLDFFLTFSFYCNLNEEKPFQIKRYIVLDKSVSQNLNFDFSGEDILEERASRCLFTVVKYQSDAEKMLAPLLNYAKLHRLTLSGDVYARQSINEYEREHCTEYYRVYAVLK
ncbi:MerR family transcriptional regulator [Sinanaerobacter sp. ZZT-01]|uniref:helix-turn-helix domain-containing protein n=1 Tax=Sinanaerobacter sp. ZZT-01 TaxID=3111540 RepID=UPI002D76FF01|nr:MerR family transcriptional regulator [Sinanaerobacter sp. ZZT-01]WRR94498.1 MerR family transcriptional regulator [Sinanaerobacter sp. ZZT-01]